MFIFNGTPSCVDCEQSASGQESAVLPPKPGSGGKKRVIKREALGTRGGAGGAAGAPRPPPRDNGAPETALSALPKATAASLRGRAGCR